MLRTVTADVFFDSVAFAAEFLYILDKQKRRVKLQYNETQRDLLRSLTGRDIVLKARQLGMSTAIQAELFRQVVTSAATTATLSHEDETTQKFRRMVDRFYDNMPLWFRPTRKYNNARVTTYPDFDSEAMIATAGNKNTGRGGTYSHIHGSEVAFWTDADVVLAGVMQAGNPHVILESTPNGAQGYFYNLCMEAMDGNSDWTLHFYPWWVDVTYAIPLEPDELLVYADDELELMRQHDLSAEQIKWRRSKQKELKHLFAQEYPEDPYTCFLLSGTGYFGDLTHAYTAPMDASPQIGRVYYAGLDFGQTTDYTVCSVLDSHFNTQVDLLRINRASWGEMRRQVRLLCQRWGVRTLVAEKNSMGATNIEELRREFDQHGCSTLIVPFETTNLSKSGIMADLHEALHHHGLLLLPISEQKREMLAFQAKQTISGQWQLSAPTNEHDDIVIANALALYAAHKGQGVLLAQL